MCRGSRALPGPGPSKQHTCGLCQLREQLTPSRWMALLCRYLLPYCCGASSRKAQFSSLIVRHSPCAPTEKGPTHLARTARNLQALHALTPIPLSELRQALVGHSDRDLFSTQQAVSSGFSLTRNRSVRALCAARDNRTYVQTSQGIAYSRSGQEAPTASLSDQLMRVLQLSGT